MIRFSKYFLRVVMLFVMALYVFNEARGQEGPGGPGGPGGSPFTITGPTTSNLNASKTYTISGAGISSVNWIVSKGTITSSSNSSATVTWNQLGTGNIYALVTNTSNQTDPVNGVFVAITNPAPPAPPVASVSALNNCGVTTISRSNPPSGIIWYWQTASNGTLTNNSASTYPVTAAGTYYLRAKNSGTSGLWSTTATPITVTIDLVPSAPSASQESNKSATSFRANWSSVSGASSYRLDVSVNSSFSSMVSGYSNKTVSGTNSTVTGLSPGKNYYYRVRAYSSDGCTSANSGTITANTTISAPSVSQESNKTPTSFRANWSSVSGASSYRLDVANNSSFSSMVSGFNNKSVSGTNATVTGLSLGNTYYYRLRAVGPNVTSGNSSVITANTTVSAPVATQETSNADGSFRANWNAVAGVSNYRIDISANSSFSSFVTGYNNFEVPPALTSLVVPGLSPGKDYYYRLRSQGSSITSGNSNVITAHTTIAAPSASEETNRTTTSFRVNWSSSTGVSSYRLDISENSSFSSYVSGYQNKSVTGTNINVTGLAPGKNYYYRLRAVGPNRTSANSNVITANTSISTPVVAQESNKTNTSFRANWSAVSGATGYLLYVSENSGFSSHLSGYNGKAVSGVNTTVSGLVAGKNYYYRLRAQGPNHNSGYSGAITANTNISAPAVSQESNKTATSFRANWSAVAGVSNFLLYVSENSSFSSHLSGYNGKSVTGTNHTITGLAVGKNYYYRLKSDGPTDSGYSSTITANTTVSAPVATQETSNANGSFRANWNAVAGVSNYRIDISESSSFSSFVTGYNNFQVPPAVTNLDVPGLLPGKDYYYRLRSQGGSITSGNSNVITAHTTISPPTANQESNRTTTGFRINWSSVSGVSSYRLDVSESSSFSSYLTGYQNKSVTGTNHTISGLSPGKNYYYRLRSVGPNRTSANSNVVTANTSISVPVASQETNKTNSSFRANWSTVSGATSYLLYVSENSSFSSHLSGYNGKTISGGSATNSTVSGLVAGKNYYYRLRAKGPHVNSGYSTTITANTTIGAPIATAGTNQNTNSIQANWNAVSGASNYRFDLSTNDQFTTFAGGYSNFEVPPTTNMVVPGLSPGTIYYYRLRTETSSSTSGNSNVITTNTSMLVPTGSAATNSTNTSFQANWVALAGAVSYQLDVATNTSFTQDLSTYNVSGTSRIVTGLTPGRDYHYRLRAVSADGITSANSAHISTNTTISAPLLAAASNVTTTSFQANWATASGAGGYIMQVSEQTDFSSFVTGYNFVLISGGNTTSYAVSGLVPGKNYYYRLQSAGDDHVSAYSQPITVIVPIDAPQIVAPSNITNNSFQVNWNAVSGAEGYMLQVSEVSDFSTFVSGYNGMSLGQINNQSITGLTGGQRYYYRLFAIGEDHLSGVSPAKEVVLSIATPVLSVSTPTSTSLLASWAAIDGALTYQLDVSEDPGFSSFVFGNENRLINGANAQITVGDLDPGKNYHFRLRAAGGGTVSANSNVVMAATAPDPTIALIGSPYFSTGDDLTLTTPLTYATYSWKKGGVTVGTGSTYVVTSTGTYTLTVTVAGVNTSGTSAPVTIHAYTGFDPGDQNYVMSTTVLQSGITTEAAADALAIGDKNVSIQYMDGLGRAIQTVGVESTPDRKHLVQPITYDEFGRQTTSYLPYAVTGNSGVFQHNPVGVGAADYTSSPQYDFYQTATNVAHDTAPFAVSVLENSPTSRVLKQGAPGAAWQPVEGSYSDHVVRMAYEMNGPNQVRLFTVVNNIPVSEGYYEAGELIITATGDEDGNESVQFTDKAGRVILKQVYTGDQSNPWAETHYVYDDYGNLRVVLPPEANKNIANNNLTNVPVGYTLVTSDLVITPANYTGGSYMYVDGISVTVSSSVTLSAGAEVIKYGIQEDFLNNWAFQYKYDHRQRMIEKRVPGAGWMYMAYDVLDRLVLTQDANQRGDNQWTFTKYDEFSRPVLTGFYTYSGSLSAVQTLINNHSSQNETVGSTVLGYTNNAFPLAANPNDYLSATYYDDYANLPADFTFSYADKLGNGANNTNVKGQVVGSKTKLLDGSGSWTENVVYYDSRYRAIETISNDHSGFKTLSVSKYDFAGRVLETFLVHKNEDTSIPKVKISETFNYDHASRLLEATHKVNNDPEVVLVKNEYNELGELIDKKLHSADNGSTFEQSVDYRYNIRGWLARVNNADLSDSEGDYFGMELAYNNSLAGTSSTATYNGNISAVQWSNYGGNGNRKSAFSYNYDAMNRLLAANYSEVGASSTVNDFSTLNFYDLNGNIMGLSRWGMISGDKVLIDDLVYDYGAGFETAGSSNQLKAVWDASGDGGLGGFVDNNTTGDDYTYDDNGNMISDANKDITSISYNHLNLPDTVTFTNDRSIVYTYDAAGIKLKKQVNKQEQQEVTNYNIIETSDFSVGLDGWNAYQGLGQANVDYAGETDVLKMTSSPTNNLHRFQKAVAFPTGEPIRIQAKIYLPSTNTNADGIQVQAGFSSSVRSQIYTTTDTWLSIDYTTASVPNAGFMFFLMKDGSSDTFLGTNNDYFFIKDIEISNASGTTTQNVEVVTTTDYVGSFLYEDEVLQQLSHAEGRVRKKDSGDFIYDYYLKDHLGNTRITFTTENEQVVYLATMETDVTAEVDYAAYEESLFLNLPATRVNTPTTANSSGEAGITNDESARLRGNDPARHIGPAKLMQVSRGDTVDLEVKAFYNSGYVDNGNIGSHILFPTIIGMVSGAAPTGAEGANITNSVNGNSASILVGGTNPTNAPRAYLNYIYFDADFNFIDAGFTQVGSVENAHQTLTKSRAISENGYLYVYVSNESDNNFDVFFDDLRITHTKSKVLQEDHYYPFGMNINALSSSAPLSKPNSYKYNGFELETSFDLGWYDYQARQYDPQLGRWFNVDPMADYMRRHSPYNYAFDNPIMFIDPDGMWPEWPSWKKIKQDFKQVVQTTTDFLNGAADAIVDNNASFGPLGPDRRQGGSDAFQAGQTAGDIVTTVQGLAEIIFGAGVTGTGGAATLATGGASSPVSVPVTVAGAAIVSHGSVVLGNSVYNLLNNGSSGDGSSRPPKTKRDKPKTDSNVDASQEQLEGIENAQKKANQAKKGSKQNKIQSTKKSQQRLDNDLKRIDDLDDLKKGGS